MSKEMYAPVDPTPFHLNIDPATATADFPTLFRADGTTSIPYTCKQIMKISAKFVL